MILFSKVYILLSYVAVLITVTAPNYLFFYLSKEDQNSVFLLFIYFLFFVCLPGMIELLKNKTETEFQIVSIRNSITGLMIGLLVIVSGFISQDPWVTRSFVGTFSTWILFIIKYK